MNENNKHTDDHIYTLATRTNVAECVLSSQTVNCRYLSEKLCGKVLDEYADISSVQRDDSVVKTLEKVPILKLLASTEKIFLSQHLSVVAFDDGQYIITQGDIAGDDSGLYIIEYGEAVITVNQSTTTIESNDLAISSSCSTPTSSRRSSTTSTTTTTRSVDGMSEVAVLKAGGFVGEIALLENVPRTANVIARGDTLCYFMSKEVFSKLIKNEDTLKQIRILIRCRDFVRDTDNVLTKIVDDSECKDVFVKFLKQIYSEEILKFYDVAREYKRLKSQEERKEKISMILEQFINKGAEYEINCSLAIKTEIVSQLEDPSPNILNKLYLNTIRDLEKDCIPRFLASKIFIDWMASKMKEQDRSVAEYKEFELNQKKKSLPGQTLRRLTRKMTIITTSGGSKTVSSPPSVPGKRPSTSLSSIGKYNTGLVVVKENPAKNATCTLL